jgi:hypothetical protein
MDPQASLAAAIAAGPDILGNVVTGIAKFHPDWLRGHFEEIPKAARASALDGLAESDRGQNPRDLLKFLKEHSNSINPDAIEAFAREDPWAAIEWATWSPILYDPFAGEKVSLHFVIRTLADESPDELARIAERTPSGKAKLEMEAALFANLVKTDPAAALEQAKAATVPRAAAERYAAIGSDVVNTDPEQALQLAKDLFAACPGAFNLTARVEYPEGGYDQSLDLPGVTMFMRPLMTRRPAKVMELIASLPPESGNEQFNTFSHPWIDQDFVAYTDWVNMQTHSDIRQKGASLIAERLRYSRDYQEAAVWALSMDVSDTDPLKRVLEDWQGQDLEEPVRWLENANLSPDRKAIIRSILDRPR